MEDFSKADEYSINAKSRTSSGRKINSTDTSRKSNAELSLKSSTSMNSCSGLSDFRQKVFSIILCLIYCRL